MSSDFRKQFEDAERLHDGGLISDDDMNEVAARYFASVRAFSADPVQAPAPRRKLGRPRKEPVIDELPGPRTRELGRPQKLFTRQILYDVLLVKAMNPNGSRNVARWSREIADRCLDRRAPGYRDSQRAIERWLRDPAANDLPTWLRTRLECVFPRRPSRY